MTAVKGESGHYPYVHIINSTAYQITGTVQYPGAFCSNDGYSIPPSYGTSWTADSRGLCLVSAVTATVSIPNQPPIEATSYQSSGTAYSQFAVIQTNSNPMQFSVTRITD